MLNDINIEKLVSGDYAVWDKFVEQYAKVIYSAVWRVFQMKTGAANPEDVEDIVQRVFIKLIKDNYRVLRLFKPEKSSLTTFLTIISRNTAIDFLRQKKLETIPIDESKIRNIKDDSGEKKSIDIPLDILSSRQKLILHLIFEQNMKTDEIAGFLKIDEQTVRSTKHKAISKLREYFTPLDKV